MENRRNICFLLPIQTLFSMSVFAVSFTYYKWVLAVVLICFVTVVFKVSCWLMLVFAGGGGYSYCGWIIGLWLR